MYLLLISIERGDLTKVLYIFLNGRNPKPSGYNGGTEGAIQEENLH